jgi:light-regulated signal transduction histidine kinase (bacteriophytochrome)
MKIKFNFEPPTSENFISNETISFPMENSASENEMKLALVTQELSTVKMHLQEYKRAMKQIMYMTSHKVRQPIANILGLSNMINLSGNSLCDVKKIINYLKQCVKKLDVFTIELTQFITEIGSKKLK